MIELLVTLLVFCIVFGIIYYILTLMPLGKFMTPAVCILGLIAILVLLGLFTGHVPTYRLLR
jgi:hypothetical protein